MGKDWDLTRPGWRGDDVSDEDFTKGFNEHFLPLMDQLRPKTEWQIAMESMEQAEDLGPFSRLFATHYPPPQWVMKRLSELTDPLADPGNVPQLKYKISRRLRKKRRTEENHLEIGVFFQLERSKGKKDQQEALGAVAASDSVIQKASAKVSKLPDYKKLPALRKWIARNEGR